MTTPAVNLRVVLILFGEHLVGRMLQDILGLTEEC